MNLYLDTEFNGHGGELISLAIAAEDGRHWYGYWGRPAPIESWVQVHVMPYIMAHEPLNLMRGSSIAVPDRDLFRASLLEYLASRVGSTIYADWPDDFAHLMRVMSGPFYEKSWLVPCTMVLLGESEPQPEIPHNALSDAIALMRWHQEHRTVDRTDDHPNSTQA